MNTSQLSQLRHGLQQLGVMSGPGDGRVDGLDASPTASFVQRMLYRVSKAASMGLLPVAELVPTDTVAMNNLVVAAGNNPSPISIIWPSNGILVGIRCSTRDGAPASLSGMLLRVQQNGNTELFPSGQSSGGAGFLSFSQISGNAAFLGRYATKREFQQETNWVMYLQNTTGGQLSVDVGFDIVRTSNLNTGSAP
jgi:hypothetical protein